MARPKKMYSDAGLTASQVENRDLAMMDLRAFIGLVAPYRALGHCHHDMLQFLMEDHNHQLILWPRGHQKSTMVAYWSCWYLINHPEATLLYASATADLAEKQLTFMKQVLSSPVTQKYWPELLDREEGRRSMWRMNEISVDHWKRHQEGIRDPSIKAVGVGGTITGFHADVIVLDDVVVLDNAESLTERTKLETWYSLLVSVLNPGGFLKAVGTRYHPSDLYSSMTSMVEPQYDEDGQVVGEIPVYNYSIEVVERDSQFLWPRQRREDGKFYGFDPPTLSRIKAQYLDKAQFFAQYYNDPSDPANKRISNFNYYNRDQLRKSGPYWYFKDKKLNVFAAIDFAATITKRADYTAIVVVGVDSEGYIYVLDIARFKTDKISIMATELNNLYNKWGWLKLKAETNAQQNLIVQQIKQHNRAQGTYYSIEEGPSKGEKAIRIMAILEPRYAAGVILHYRGGNCQILEDELMASRPAHDDVSDAFASVCEIIITPRKHAQEKQVANLVCHPRFGGVS